MSASVAPSGNASPIARASPRGVSWTSFSAHSLRKRGTSHEIGHKLYGSLRKQAQRPQTCVASQIRPYGPGDEFEQGRPDKVFSFLTPEGVIQFSSQGKGSSTPRRRRATHDPLPTWQEQGLCIASTFSLAATNGRDLSRRVIWQGYAQSVPHLVEAVEDTVLWRGGKIALQECQTVETYAQALKMTVVLPLLWSSSYSGTPELDTLNYAITEAGGVIEAVKKQWYML
uniref:DUF7811 domain-containing protein n=1 Tax=Tetraselmis chuii TaxID=63592 RepID=A0A7S1SJ80_9CHLO|mmetsp:Transcript_15205/g.26904  ORF Transcript_15205/g.26904 Transcript_15205/m.26904 type:complete len:228 (+) Transcript_15205:215-898(+)